MMNISMYLLLFICIQSQIGQGAPRFFLSLSPELPDSSFAKILVLAGNDQEREHLKHKLRQKRLRMV